MNLAVYAISQNGRDAGKRVDAGFAYANADGSLTISLKLLPLDGVLRVEPFDAAKLLFERDEARSGEAHYREALRHCQIERDEALADALQRKAELAKRGGR